MPKFTNPRVIVKKDRNFCYIMINDVEHQMTPDLAKEVGNALFKTGADVAALRTNDVEKGK